MNVDLRGLKHVMYDAKTLNKIIEQQWVEYTLPLLKGYISC